MATRRNSGSSCGVVLLIIVLVIAAIFVYQAGLMPLPVVQFLEPIGKQLEPITKQLEAFAQSIPGITPTPVVKP